MKKLFNTVAILSLFWVCMDGCNGNTPQLALMLALVTLLALKTIKTETV